MGQATQHAVKGFYFSKSEPTYMLTVSLTELFCISHEKASSFLQIFYHLLPNIALAQTHTE